MTSAIDIANQALSLAGARSIITSFSEQIPEGQQCTIWYEQDRQWLLRKFNWGFARRQDALSLLATAPGVAPQPATNLPWPFMPWSYAYQYPSDCVRFRSILPTYNASPVQPQVYALPQPPVPFLVSSFRNDAGNVVESIFTNQTQAFGIWTRDLTDTTLFDAMFVEALSHLLASHLAIPLAGDKALANSLFQKAISTAADATSINGNEGLTVQDHVPDWVRIRGYAVDWMTPYYPWGEGYYGVGGGWSTL